VKTNLADQFKEFHDALWHPEAPNQGYMKAFNQMTETGRAKIAEDAARRGERNFPPNRKVVP
jgi:hypothetical protein